MMDGMDEVGCTALTILLDKYVFKTPFRPLRYGGGHSNAFGRSMPYWHEKL